MGTRFNLVLPGIENSVGDVIFASVIQELKRIETMLSCFMPESDISHINENAFTNPVEISNELFDILAECLKYYKMTDKAFDISLGKLIDHWNGAENNGDPEKLDRGSGADKIILDHSRMSVRFSTPHVKINLGGYGKGYALQNIQDLLKKKGLTDAFISFGESSVSCLGKHPHGDFWPVGIQDFYHKDKSLATIQLVNESVSTSGNMEKSNFFIDPKNGKTVKKEMMISVKSLSAVDAEVLSTALMVADANQWEKIKDAFPGNEIIKVVYRDEKAEVERFNF